MKHLKKLNSAISVAAFISLGTFSNSSFADIIHADDVIILGGSLCVGFDCVDGESFGFDTLRLKENNLRIKAQDTSNSATFPSNDWQLTFNDITNGGLNKFSVDDVSNGRTPFTIEASAPSHSLYVDDGGRIGVGTSTPSVEVHVKDGDTPTVRLEQDVSSGFGAQSWDVAGNETNFFIRDVTNGSALPFKIIPGADSNSLVIAANNNVGFGTSNTPSAALHVRRTTAGLIPDMLKLENAGDVRFQLTDTAVAGFWRMSVENAANQFVITRSGTGAPELKLTNLGDLEIRGGLTANVGTTNDTFPDYVFERNYPLMELSALEKFISKNKHLPNVPSKADVSAKGGQLNMTTMQLKLLEKVEELTLYTLAQQKTIKQQEQKNKQQELEIAKNSQLQERLASLEKLFSDMVFIKATKND